MELAIAAVGSVIGGATLGTGVVAFGMTGAAIGWAAGSLVASMLTPAQKVQGSRLGDLSVTGSSYGTVIPYFEGVIRVAGQIVYASKKKETSTTSRQGGKGGGGQKVTTFTYSVDLLILLSDCTIAPDALKVFSNGDLIYATQIGTDGVSLLASQTSPPWERMTVYSGEATQMPDPDYEAAVGIANALAYRDRGTVFIKGLQIGQGGQIPNLTFVIAREFTSASTDYFWLEEVSGSTKASPFEYAHPPPPAWMNRVEETPANVRFGISALKSINSRFNEYTGWSGGSDASKNAFVIQKQDEQRIQHQDFTIDLWVRLESYPTSGDSYVLAQVGGYHTLRMDSDGYVFARPFDNLVGGFGISIYGEGLFDGLITRNPQKVPLNTWTHVAMQRNDLQWSTVVGGQFWIHQFHGVVTGSMAWWEGSPDGDGYGTIARSYQFTYEERYTTPSWAAHMPISDPQKGMTFGSGDILGGPRYNHGYSGAVNQAPPMTVDALRLSRGVLFPGGAGSPPSAAPVKNTQAISVYNFENVKVNEAKVPTIQEVVQRLCARAEIPTDQVDAIALATIPTPVHSMLLSQVATVRSVLELLMGCYFFDVSSADVLTFRPRARPSEATIPFDDTGWARGGEDFEDKLALSMSNELELPAQISIAYLNIDSDFQTDTQHSDRVFTSQVNNYVIQLPLGFTASEAKRIVDARLADMYVGLLTSKVRLTSEYANLESTDCVILVDHDGSRYRQRITAKQDLNIGLVELDTVGDDASVFTQLGLTVGGVPEQTNVAPLPETQLVLFEPPMLRDSDNHPGHYMAVNGEGERWRLAEVYASRDAVSYVLVDTFFDQAVLGTAALPLQPWGGFSVFDEFSFVDVDVGDGTLSSSTRETLLNNPEINASMLGAELLQFRVATLLSYGVYRLTGFLRGRRGTDWAMGAHAAEEEFILLTTQGIRFVPMDVGDLDRIRYYKAVSAGQRLSAVDGQAFTPHGVNLEPLSPAQIRANRDAPDTVLTVRRRTRFTTRFGGPGIQSAPLGESGENYEIDVYADGTFATVVRTLVLAETNTITYAAAEQSADFSGSPPIAGSLFVKAYQVSSIVGRGYPLQAAL